MLVAQISMLIWFLRNCHRAVNLEKHGGKEEKTILSKTLPNAKDMGPSSVIVRRDD